MKCHWCEDIIKFLMLSSLQICHLGYTVHNFTASQNLILGAHQGQWNTLDSKVHGANMGPPWGRQDPGAPHVGPMNFAIWDPLRCAWRGCLMLQGIQQNNVGHYNVWIYIMVGNIHCYKCDNLHAYNTIWSAGNLFVLCEEVSIWLMGSMYYVTAV